MRNKLTRKQTIFVREVIKGSNATQAALAAYDTDNVNSAKVIGSKLLTNANIQEVINDSLNSEGLSPSVLAKNIGNLANSTPQKVSGETVLKANVELLKLHGAYPNNKTTIQRDYMAESMARFDKMSVKELEEELENIRAETAEILAESEDLENSKNEYPPHHPN